MIKVGNTRRIGSVGARVLRPGGSAPPVVCAQPLDATEAQLLDRLGWAKLVPSNSDQTGTYTVAGTEQVKAMSIAGVDLGTYIPFSTETHAFRVSFDIQALSGGADVKLDAALYLYGSGFADGLAVSVQGLTNGSFKYRVVTSGSVERFVSIAEPTIPAYFDLLIANGTLRVWAESTELTLSNSTISDIDRFPIMQVYEGASIGAANLGKTATVNWITSASDMTGSAVPAGTTDLCGNTI